MFGKLYKPRKGRRSLAMLLAAVLIVSSVGFMPSSVVEAEELGPQENQSGGASLDVSGGDGIDENELGGNASNESEPQSPNENEVDPNMSGETSPINSQTPIMLSSELGDGEYEFYASELSGKLEADTPVGTDQYFTIKATSGKAVDWANSSGTYDNGETYTARLKFGGDGAKDYRNITFTVSEGTTATITLAAESSNSSKEAPIVLYDAATDTQVQTTTLPGSATRQITTWENIAAGTYYIMGKREDSATQSSVNLCYIKVKEDKIPVAAPSEYEFYASELSGKLEADTPVGTDQYFTIKATSGKAVDWANSSGTYDNGETYTARLKFGGDGAKDYRNITFTVSEGTTATITLAAESSNSSKEAPIVLYDAATDTQVQTTTLPGSATRQITTWENIAAGTYYIMGKREDSATQSSVNLCYIKVTETPNTTVVEKVTVTPTITGTLPEGKSVYLVNGGNKIQLVNGQSVEIDAVKYDLIVADASGSEDTDYRATIDDQTSFNAKNVNGDIIISVTSAFVNPKVTLTSDSVAMDGEKLTFTNKADAADTQTVSVGESVKLRVGSTYTVTSGKEDTKAVVGSSADVKVTDDMTEVAVTVSLTAVTPSVVVDETEVKLNGADLILTADGETHTLTNGSFGKLTVGTTYTISCSDANITAEIDAASTVTIQADTKQIAVILSVKQEGLYNIDFSDGLKAGQTYANGCLTVLEDMPLKSDGTVQGADNPKDASGNGAKGTVPVSGAAIKIVAQDNGRLQVTMKNNSKDVYFVDATNEDDLSYETEKQAGAAYITKTYKLEKGHTYYLYVNGSKIQLSALTVDYRTAMDWDALEAPVLKTPIVNNGEGTITVPYVAQVGNRYADSVDIRMIKDNEVVDTINVIEYSDLYTEGSVTFTPPASGVYTFQALLNRAGEVSKVSEIVVSDPFVLPMAVPVIVGVENQGSGNMRFSWGAVTEAESYEVYLDGVLIGNSSEPVYHFTGLTAGKTYTFGVRAVGNGTVSEIAETKQTVTAEAKKTWQFTAYGSSVSSKSADDGYEPGADASNPVEGASVWSLNGKGKLVPNSTDGLAFYYTTMDPATENFTLSADITVDQWTYSNGQEGFGIMAADTIGANGDSSSIWNNSYMASVTKVEYYWNASLGQVSDAGQKYGMYLGVGAQEKKNVTPENIAGMADGSMTAEFGTTMTTLETSAARNEELLPGNYNIVGAYTKEFDKAADIKSLTKFHLSIQRNNTGYIISYTDEEGNTTSKLYYHGDDGDELTKLDPNNIYLGFFASRNAKITVNNVQLSTIAPENDAPAEERPISYVTPSYTVESPHFTTTKDYTLVYYGNADGTLTLKCSYGTIVEDMKVAANTKVRIPCYMYSDEMNFEVIFTPDVDYRPSKYEVLSTYETKTIKHRVVYQVQDKNVIYVSPTGEMGGEGTREDPLDIYTAVQRVTAGDQIILMEGTYDMYSTLTIERGVNGTADKMISMFADPEASTRPVLDFGKQCAGMVMAGDYWYFQGFDVTRSSDGQKGIQVSGSYNVLDNLMTYRNGNTGIQIARYKSSDLWEDWPSNNLVLNCTSYLNADSGYEDADGFAAKLTIADGNVFDGCIAAYNADDGWDCFAKVETGPIGKVTIKNSVAFKNGYLVDEAGNLINAGNGNGFKMGGESLTGYHTLINSVAFANKAKGIDSNSCPDIQIYNSTSYDNESYNVAFYTNNAKNTDFYANGVLSYKTSNNVAEQLKPVGLQDQSKIYALNNYYYNGTSSVNTKNQAVSQDWFENLDTQKAINGGITRAADNTILMGGYLALTDAAPADTGARIDGNGTPSRNLSVGDVEWRETSVDPDDDNGGGSGGAGSVEEDIDWNKVNIDVKAEQGLTDGSNLNVQAGSNLFVPGSVIDNLDKSNVTIALQVGGGFTFSISGSDVMAAAKNGIDLTNSVGHTSIPSDVLGRKLTGTLESRQISIKNEAAFGMNVNLHVALSAQNAGKYANLYRYNRQTKELEYAGSYLINKAGRAMFSIVSGGEYLVTVTAAKPNEIIKVTGGSYVVKRGDTLSKICALFRVRLADVLQLNPQIKNANMIYPGQGIRLR